MSYLTAMLDYMLYVNWHFCIGSMCYRAVIRYGLILFQIYILFHLIPFQISMVKKYFSECRNVIQIMFVGLIAIWYCISVPNYLMVSYVNITGSWLILIDFYIQFIFLHKLAVWIYRITGSFLTRDLYTATQAKHSSLPWS